MRLSAFTGSLYTTCTTPHSSIQVTGNRFYPESLAKKARANDVGYQINVHTGVNNIKDARLFKIKVIDGERSTERT